MFLTDEIAAGSADVPYVKVYITVCSVRLDTLFGCVKFVLLKLVPNEETDHSSTTSAPSIILFTTCNSTHLSANVCNHFLKYVISCPCLRLV